MLQNTDRVTELYYPTTQEAWARLNLYIAQNEHEIVTSGRGASSGSELILHNVFVVIDKARIDPNFDFGLYLGYTDKKWVTLVKNYVDYNYLDLIRVEINKRKAKKSNKYNFTFHFSNKYGSGKDCLISITFSKRSRDVIPVLTYHIRTSEISKRLIFDFLLVERIGEYIYGKNYPYKIHFYAPSLFITGDGFTMLNTYYTRTLGKDIHQLLAPAIEAHPDAKFSARIERTFQKYKTIHPDSVSYKVSKKSVLQIQLDENGWPLSKVKSLLAKNLKLRDNFNGVEKIENLKDLPKALKFNRR